MFSHIFSKNKLYSLNKSRHILHTNYSIFKKKGAQLTEIQRKYFEDTLRNLEEAIFANDREKADDLAKKVEIFADENFTKTHAYIAYEIVIALAFALLIATIVRQSWFELYEIPTGSMRPSYREQDRLTVTKTAFGINVPLSTAHFYFDEDLVKRAGAIIFSTDNLPMSDTDSTYFGIFPYKKRYIKRLIGKPGDTLYFYGGEIYGLDKNGDPIQELIDDPWMKKNEHIPFLTFQGSASRQPDQSILFHQFNQPIARIAPNLLGTPRGEINVDGKWIKETPFEKDQNKINAYSDFWGMNNFAIAVLLTKDELAQDPTIDMSKIGDGLLYLKIIHHPNLSNPQGALTAFSSVIPMNQKQLDQLMDNMYTARIVVNDGMEKNYGEGRSTRNFSGVPSGTYDMYNGKGEAVGRTGWTSPLPKDHPLYDHSPKSVQRLFNSLNRYIYYRDGDLYSMGSIFLDKNDPVLVTFVENEQNKAEKSTAQSPYLPFIDSGSPIKDGVWDKNRIKTFGLKLPEKQYLALGDNHANSADSRVFGFVPEENLQGVPSLLLWPPGERWGLPPQTPYPFFSVPRLIVWSVVAFIIILWYSFYYFRNKRKLFP